MIGVWIGKSFVGWLVVGVVVFCCIWKGLGMLRGLVSY